MKFWHWLQAIHIYTQGSYTLVGLLDLICNSVGCTQVIVGSGAAAKYKASTASKDIHAECSNVHTDMHGYDMHAVSVLTLTIIRVALCITK